MYAPILTRCIVCPKCQTKTMRVSVAPTLGKEYFDDKCRQYFGIDELVNNWGYDLGDFYGENKMTELGLEEFSVLVDMERRNIPYYSVPKKLFSGGLSEKDYEVAERLIISLPD